VEEAKIPLHSKYSSTFNFQVLHVSFVILTVTQTKRKQFWKLLRRNFMLKFWCGQDFQQQWKLTSFKKLEIVMLTVCSYIFVTQITK